MAPTSLRSTRSSLSLLPNDPKNYKMTSTPTFKLPSSKIPQVGFGLWKVPAAEAADTVYNALKAGYRLLDGACDYGNEKECGEGLARAIKDGVVTREEVFVTSKLWNTFHAKEHVLLACKKQLADWGLDYFDLYLIHFPVSLEYVPIETRYPPEWWNGTQGGPVTLANDPISATWTVMEEIKDAGLAKEIGVSNFCGGLVIDLLRHARIKPSVLQIEHHPYLTQPTMVALAKELGIVLTAYSSFGPQSFLEINHPKALTASSLLENPKIAQIAKKHGKTTAQVLLRWSTQRGICVIPKSTNVGRAAENLANVEFDLTAEDLEAIGGLDIGLRFNDPSGIDPRLAIFA